MTDFLDKLNLRPQERRLVVGILVVIFIVLNVLLVWPHFGDWARVRADLADAQDALYKYNRKIAQASGPNGFAATLKKLEGEGANNVVAEEQEIQLLRTVQTQVAQSKILVSRYGSVTKSTSGPTNEFFEEQSLPIDVNTGEKELIDFLVNVGSGNSMIRVRDLNLKPADQNRYRLAGTITLTANYQKKPVAKPVPKPAPAPTTPAPKSAAPAPLPKKPTAPASVPAKSPLPPMKKT